MEKLPREPLISSAMLREFDTLVVEMPAREFLPAGGPTAFGAALPTSRSFLIQLTAFRRMTGAICLGVQTVALSQKRDEGAGRSRLIEQIDPRVISQQTSAPICVE